MSVASVPLIVAGRILGGIILMGTILDPGELVSTTGLTTQFNIQAQIACEAQMLHNMAAREVFSGKANAVLPEIARAYGRAIPHIYVFPGGPNMYYVATSTAVDGRGKILVGQQAITLFDTIALKGFLGHEMAHLVTDNAARGCNDYILRDPQMEADADALAARAIGTRPVKAFLKQVLALTDGENWDAKRRLKLLRTFQSSKQQRHDAGRGVNIRRKILPNRNLPAPAMKPMRAETKPAL